MNGTPAGALKGDEIRNSRYLDALHAFRPLSGLRMDAGDGGGAGGDGGGAGGGGGQGGSGGSGDGSGGQGGSGGQQQQQQQQQGSDKGFPADTAVSEMTPV